MRCSGVLLALLFSGFAVGQLALPELLRGVDSETVRRIEEHNGSEFDQNIYFASRYRVVEVNAALLLEADPFTITLFPGSELIVERSSPIRVEGDISLWKGLITSPRIAIEAISDAKIHELGMTRTEMVQELYGLELMTHRREIASSGEAHTQDAHEIRSITAEINLREHDILGGRFQNMIIYPLHLTPKYHLVIELDSDKTFGVDSDPHDQSVSANHQREKARRYKEYLDSLPPIPQRAVVEDVN